MTENTARRSEVEDWIDAAALNLAAKVQHITTSAPADVRSEYLRPSTLDRVILGWALALYARRVADAVAAA